MDITFLDKEHEMLFAEIRRGMANESFRKSKEYLAVAFLIAGDEELNRKVGPYFDIKQGALYSEEMFENEDFSSGYRVLAELAVHLFNNNKKPEILDIIANLDERLFVLAINSIYMRRYGISTTYNEQKEQIFH